MHHLGGAIRAIDPAATVRRTTALFDRLGVTRLGNITGLDRIGVPTWVVVRPEATSLSVAQGKGITDDLAKASAIMEAVEHHHGEHVVPDGEILTLRQARSRPECADPDSLHRSDRVVDEDLAAARWIAGRELGTGEERWIPHQLFSLGATREQLRTFAFYSSSNGLAAGNTLDEAVLHALCEVIERDQMSFWAIATLSEPDRYTRVRLDSIDVPAAGAIFDRCASAGLEVFVDYLTTNIGLPVFRCVVADATARTAYRQRTSGAGCHPSKEVALLRAVTEALQARLSVIAGLRDDFHWREYKHEFSPGTKPARLALDRMRLTPEVVPFDEIPEIPPQRSFGDYINKCLTVLEAARTGIPIVVDLTQPDIGLPVVHVCVPDTEYQAHVESYVPGKRMLQFLTKELARD
jgi:ribosomal protein S12 methylthiotransferase accessory factor